MYADIPFLERRPGSTELVVLLHGFRNQSDRLREVREVIRQHQPCADLYAPAMPTRRLSCRVPAAELVADLTDAIDFIVAARPELHRYKSIALVGHSVGAVFARKISIVAHGEQIDANGAVPAPFEAPLQRFRQARPWARCIRRVVLLAGMNRGWSTESGRNTLTSFAFGVGQFIGELLGGNFTIFSIRRGAPFLVQTRLQWLALMNADYGGRPDLTIVQLLGTVDEAVAPDDSIDFAIDGINNAGNAATYNYLEVPYSGHADIVCMAPGGAKATEAARKGRRDRFLEALTATPLQLAACRINREQMEDTLPPPPDPAVRDMVFVVHGIRDKGFWTKKIARTIKEEATQAGQRFESWTEGYGYFAMLPFLLKSVRQRKVAWLMDRYCEARARYPNAAFHYVGHSNGTYLAARALCDYPAAKFARVLFAGSVVRRDYDWQTVINAGRVGKVLNYVSTADYVVAVFGKSLQRWGVFDIGSAGHDGFDHPAVNRADFIEGGHGAGHEEAAWDDIARFIVHGTVPNTRLAPFQGTQKRPATWLGDFPEAAVVFLVGCAVLPFVVLAWLFPLTDTPWPIILWTLLLVAYLRLLVLIVTRV
jgi:pimeloyl-ACP methyl ester carboxylesterase